MLTDLRKLRPQGQQVPIKQRHAVQSDCARSAGNKAWKQIDQRCFSCPRAAHQCNGFAGANLKRKVVQCSRICRVVDHRHMRKPDGAIGPGLGKAATAFNRRTHQQLNAFFDGGESTGERVGDFGEVFYRRDQHQHGGDKRGKSTNGGRTRLALHQGHCNDGRQGHSRQHLCQGRHGSRRSGRFHEQTVE